MDNGGIQDMWKRATAGLPEDMCSRWWDLISQHYCEPQRHYHTLQHISHMFSTIQQHQPHLVSLHTLVYAVIFHDVIYDPKACDNEEKSAVLFKTFAQEAELQCDIISEVFEWIILTKLHTTDVHSKVGQYGSDHVHYFLDADMAILGSSYEDYEKYADQIRKEYIHIPEKEYNTRRSQVLTEFLKKVNIYATSEFRKAYEAIARSNIQQEISRLQGA